MAKEELEHIEELAYKLREFGHRYPESRAGYIIEARKYKDNIKQVLDAMENETAAREWLVENIKGLGYKESSHFLRNIGYKNLAIIDFHILALLKKHAFVKKPQTLTPSRYLEIERTLRNIGDELDLTLAELDLYLWYMETGKVLK